MVRMIDDLLEVSRITQGKIRVRPERVDLVAILEHAIETTEPDRAQQHQKLEVSLPGRRRGWTATPFGSSRCSSTFCTTRTSSRPPSGPSGFRWPRTRTTPGAGPSSACGTRAPDQLVGARAHLRSFRAGRPSQRGQPRGLGIGLTLAKQLVDMHGGTIDAFSAGENRGSEFVVRLPLKSAPDATLERSRKGGARLTRSNGAKRVLIVDDDWDGGEAMRLLLKHSGNEVQLAENGEVALARVSQFRPDVILIDIGLPRMDGYQVVRELRRREGTAPR
jgi:hypothetical protein